MKRKRYIIIVILLLIGLVIGYFMYNKFAHKNSNKEYAENIKRKVLKDEKNNITITCKTNDCSFVSDSMYYNGDGKYVLIRENANIDVYTIDDGKFIVTLGNVKNAELFGNKKNIYVTNNEDKSAIYNLDKKKYITDFGDIQISIGGHFSSIAAPYEPIFYGNAIVITENDKYGIMSLNDGKILYNIEYDEYKAGFDTNQDTFENDIFLEHSKYVAMKKDKNLILLQYSKETQKIENIDMDFLKNDVSDLLGLSEEIILVKKGDGNIYFCNLKTEKYKMLDDVISEYRFAYLDKNIAKFRYTSDNGFKCIQYIYNKDENTIVKEEKESNYCDS